jgi:hypothetical protein
VCKQSAGSAAADGNVLDAFVCGGTSVEPAALNALATVGVVSNLVLQSLQVLYEMYWFDPLLTLIWRQSTVVVAASAALFFAAAFGGPVSNR